jgi:hypothetical protein
MNFLLLFTLAVLFIIFITSLGFFFLNIVESEEYDKVSSLLGLSIFIFFSNIFYFFFNFNIVIIAIIFIFLFVTSFYFNLKIFYNRFSSINISNFFLSTPIIFFFIFLASIYGEQFYIFRGNYWDYFYYIKQALLISDNNFKDLPLHLYGLSDGITDVLNDKFNYEAPSVSTILSFFLKLKFFSVFELTYVFTIILLSLVSISFNFIFFKINKVNYYLIPIVFTLSFWCLYIFEIQALRHLCSLGLFISSIGLLYDFKINFNKQKLNYFLILIFIESSIFLIYSEFFLFNALFLLIYFFLLIFKKKISPWNYKIILIILFFFVILSFPGYKSNLVPIINNIKNFKDLSGLDFWGYYGAFILGKNNLVNNSDFVENLKYHIQSNNFGSYNLFQYIIQSHFLNNYNLILINIIPSFFGFYFLTEGSGGLLFAFLIVVINIYLITKFSKNLYFIFKYSNNFHLILISLFVTWLTCSIILLLNSSYWGLIKLYFYFFIFFLLTTFFIYKKEKTIFYLSPNLLLILLLTLFPFYKYSQYNSGISRNDSFPSILNSSLKKDFHWFIDRNEIKSCHNIVVQSKLNKENVVKTYYIKLILTHDMINYNYYFDEKKLLNNSYDCRITISSSKFLLRKK